MDSALTRKCCCGKVFHDAGQGTVVIERPCRCEHPGESYVPRPDFGVPNWVTEKQYRQRTKLGLPPVTEIERHAMRKKL